jgi:hypothetical protein
VNAVKEPDHQIQSTDAKPDDIREWMPPSPVRSVLFMATFIGFWMFYPFGVCAALIHGMAGVNGADWWWVWTFLSTALLLALHCVYAFITSPWEKRGPGYRGYVVNSVALMAGIVFLVWTGPEVVAAAFDPRYGFE